MAVVCLRVTTVAIGVVMNFETAPAKKPTPNSSMTGRCFDRVADELIRDCRRKL